MPRVKELSVMEWSQLIDSLWDVGEGGRRTRLPGVSLYEWLSLVQCDYDEVDRMIVEAETVGGD